MNAAEFESLAARMRVADKRTCEVLVQDMPRSGKGREAFFALLQARAVVDELHRALVQEMHRTQLARLAYMDAAYGGVIH